MADKLVKCVVLRDFWDEKGERVRAGSVVEVPADEAMDAVEAGLVSRVKDPNDHS